MKYTHILVSLLALLTAQVFSADFKDDFTNPKLKERRTGRGDWTISDGVARCTQDNDVFKKNQDHGPIIMYEVPTQDSTVHFAFRPQGCKAVFFQMDGANGHAFRVIIGDTVTAIRAWPGGSIGHAAKAIAQDDSKLVQGEWNEVTVEIRGPKATVKIGKHYAKTVEDPAFSEAKTKIMIMFNYGTLELKGFTVQP